MDKESKEVVYCVTAIIDLLGFSSHLEVGSGDIRTTIGQQAIGRLQTLADSLDHLEREKSKCQRITLPSSTTRVSMMPSF